MILYACRSCGVRVWYAVRPQTCTYCSATWCFDEVWTALDYRLTLALEAWNVREVLTGKFKLAD